MPLEVGKVYRFATFDLARGVDPVMHLLDETNMELAQNDDAAPPDYNSMIEYTPSTTGLYYIVVRSFTQYSMGSGGIRWMWRSTGGVWGFVWTVLEPEDHFGGHIVPIEPAKSEYRSVMRQTPAGGCPDTLMYTMDFSQQITNYDDDGGIGWMSKISIPFTSYPTHYILVGAWSTPGTVDLVANDVDRDTDGDHLGAGLEVALGTCDSATPGCEGVINYKDSDHDGLADDAEVFGIAHPTDRNLALHLPAWGANPRKKDVFIEQDWSEHRICQTGVSCSTSADCPSDWSCESGVCTEQWWTLQNDPCWPVGTATNPFTSGVADAMQSKFVVAPQDDIKNRPETGDGVALHFDVAASGDPCPSNRTLCGGWGGGGDRTNVQALSAPRKGVFRHFRAEPGTFGQGGGDTFHAGISASAKKAVHELGHSLGLTHSGHWKWDSSGAKFASPYGEVEVNCKPHYNSLMNYAYKGPGAEDFWEDYNFSLGQNLATLDPANVLETAAPFAVPAHAGRLRYDYPTPMLRTLHLFPAADELTGHVDWNRDGQLPATGAVRGALVSGGDQCGAHRMSAVELTPSSEAGTATPDLAAYFAAQRLFAFFAVGSRTAVVYRAAELGTSDKGGCTVGDGRAWSSCHAFGPTKLFAEGAAPPGVLITAVSALQWNGQLVLVYVGNDRKARVNRATGYDAMTGALTGWSSSWTVVAEDVDSFDIELAPMYVRTNKGVPLYLASHSGDVDSELLALFYTSGTEASAVHRFRTATPGDVLAPWSVARSVNVAGAALPGDVAPGVAVWPARSGNTSLPTYRDVGFACGIFPGRLDGTSRSSRRYCYDKGTDEWIVVAGPYDQQNNGRKPPFAFHTLRSSAGAVVDDRRGQFWGGEADLNGVIKISVSELVGPTPPPNIATWGLRFHGLVDGLEKTWRTEGQTGVSLYADRDVSAVKALALYQYAAMPGAPIVRHFEVQGLFDGSFHAELKDGNDFRVMEHGICRNLHPDPPPPAPRNDYCCNGLVTDRCIGYYNLDL